MLDASTAPWGILLLRVCLAARFVAHAMLKWRVFTIPGTVSYFRSLGLPGWFAYVTDRRRAHRGRSLVAGRVAALRRLVAGAADA